MPHKIYSPAGLQKSVFLALPRLKLLSSALLAVLGLLTLLPPVALAQAQAPLLRQLNMAIPYNEQHLAQTEVFLPWAEAIRRQSRGNIHISVFDARSLLMEVDARAALVTGSLDLSSVLPSSIFPAPPVSNLLNLYLNAPDARTASCIIWDFLEAYPPLQAELRLMHVLWAWSSSPLYIHSKSKPVQSLDDIRGLKWVVWSDIMEEFVKLAGGTPLRCMPAESSLLLRNGLADGIICPIPPLLSFNIASHIRFTTDYPLIFLSFYMCMNKEIWNAMPPNFQSLFTNSTGRVMSQRCGQILDEAENKVRKKMTEKGHTFIPVSAEFKQSYQERITPIRQARFTKLQSLNIPKLNDFRPLLHSIQEKIQQEYAQKE